MSRENETNTYINQFLTLNNRSTYIFKTQMLLVVWKLLVKLLKRGSLAVHVLLDADLTF